MKEEYIWYTLLHMHEVRKRRCPHDLLELYRRDLHITFILTLLSTYYIEIISSQYQILHDFSFDKKYAKLMIVHLFREQHADSQKLYPTLQINSIHAMCMQQLWQNHTGWRENGWWMTAPKMAGTPTCHAIANCHVWYGIQLWQTTYDNNLTCELMYPRYFVR